MVIEIKILWNAKAQYNENRQHKRTDVNGSGNKNGFREYAIIVEMAWRMIKDIGHWIEYNKHILSISILCNIYLIYLNRVRDE